MDKCQQFKQECIDLYSELNLESLLDKIADKICDYLDCKESSIFLYDSIKEELYFEIATGSKKEELKKIVLRKGEGLVGWVAEHDQSEIVNDCAGDPRFTAVADKRTKFVTSSLLAVPVKRSNKLLGVLEAVNKVEGTFSDDDRQLLECIAGVVSIPLQNALLYKKVKEETNEKERLIKMGKIVSLSFDLDEVFKTLRNIITEIIAPLEINVMVKSQDRTYNLMPEKKSPYRDAEVQETTIDSRQGLFPLRVKNNTLGYLEIKTRKKIPDETVSLIKGIAIFAAISIEKFEMHKRMLEKEKLERELDIAKDIQRSFLPGKVTELKGIDTAYVNVPSSAVGGDYFDIVRLDENQTIFTINDISGHGIPASLPMSIFSASFRYRVNKDKDMLTTIEHLNDLLAETTGMEQYVTSFTCCLDMEHMTMKYINAGHHYPLIFRGDRLIEPDEGETVLGLFPDIARSIKEVELEKGDLLMLYTDGIIEAENAKGEQFSKERLVEFVQGSRRLDAESIKNNLIEELKRHVNSSLFEDDITFIIIKIK
jgi:serine phosphatase RsbU (regulator of sigma subunit)/putative methionine-R-sulfoxide reductase with GAF domain